MAILKKVDLTEKHKQYADSVARMFQGDAEENNRPPGMPFDRSTLLKNHIQSARGKLATRIATGLPWDPKKGDTGPYADLLGDCYCVKTVDAFHKTLLVPKDELRLDLIYILVVSEDGTTHHLVGWKRGQDFKDEWFNADLPYPAYQCRKADLDRDMDAMPLPVERKQPASEGPPSADKKETA